MATGEQKIVNVDTGAAKEAVGRAGRKARKVVANKVEAGSKRAKDVARKGGSAAKARVSGAARDVQDSIRGKMGKTTDSAVRHALRACIDLSKRQVRLLEGVEKRLPD